MKIDEFHYHEIADRLYIIMSNIEEHIINHVASDKRMKKDCKKAISLLYKVYNKAGCLSDKISEKNK